jgi:hypothetical protein
VDRSLPRKLHVAVGRDAPPPDAPFAPRQEVTCAVADHPIQVVEAHLAAVPREVAEDEVDPRCIAGDGTPVQVEGGGMVGPAGENIADLGKLAQAGRNSAQDTGRPGRAAGLNECTVKVNLLRRPVVLCLVRVVEHWVVRIHDLAMGGAVAEHDLGSEDLDDAHREGLVAVLR